MTQNLPGDQSGAQSSSDQTGQPEAPQYQQPTAPHYQQPAAPQYQQPAAPQYQQPVQQFQQQGAPQYQQYQQYQQAPGYPAPGGYPQPEEKGLAIASMVLGIVGIVFAWIPGVNWLALPAAIVGLILGIVALRKGQPRGMALTGIILGAIAVLFAIVAIVLAIWALMAFGSIFGELASEISRNS